MQVVLNLKDFENDYFSVFLKGRLKRVVGRIALKKCFERWYCSKFIAAPPQHNLIQYQIKWCPLRVHAHMINREFMKESILKKK